MTLFSGITAKAVETSRVAVNVLVRDGDDVTATDHTIVFLHDFLTSAQIWQETLLALPNDLRVIAIDLRGFGRTEHAPIDATRGVRDFSDDVRATLDALDIETAHFVGWGLGAAVATQFAMDHKALSLTLEAPVSFFGLGGTRLDGSLTADDAAGSGAGLVPAELVERVQAGDETADALLSPLTVFRTQFVAEDSELRHEDVWLDSMLETSTATGNFPGDVSGSSNWPGFAPGTTGALNAVSPKYFTIDDLTPLVGKPPVLWIRGDADLIISDESVWDVAVHGRSGNVDGWPGDDFPPQPMLQQTRRVLDAYRESGATAVEVVFAGAGHSIHLERPEEFRAALLESINYLRPSYPPTESIILRSAD